METSSGARGEVAQIRRVEDDEFDEEDLNHETKSRNQENRNRSNQIKYEVTQWSHNR